MSPLVYASVIALFRATLSSPDPVFGPDAPSGPEPLAGVWAALPPDCSIPSSQNLALWPKCATPIGFIGGEVAALQVPDPDHPPPDGQLYAIGRTKYRMVKALAPGAPDLVELDVPAFLSKSTLYLAIRPQGVTSDGRFTSATGWPVGCPTQPQAGIEPSGKGCVARSPDAVRVAADAPPPPDRIYRLVRIPASGETAAASAEGPSPAPAGEPPSTSGGAPASTAAGGELPAEAPVAADRPSTPPTAAPGVVGETPLPPPSQPSGPSM